MSLNVNKIGYTTYAINENLRELKDVVKAQGKEMRDLTKKIEENTRTIDAPKKDWKYVHEPTESERHPLANSDVKKLLNVI